MKQNKKREKRKPKKNVSVDQNKGKAKIKPKPKKVFKEEDYEKEVNRVKMCEEVSMMRSESIIVECVAV